MNRANSQRNDAKDAARYRWLVRMWPIDLLMLLNSHVDDLDDKTCDEAIDFAMEKQRHESA